MTKHRFFLPEERWLDQKVEIKSDAVVRQILTVLRLKTGDQLIVLDGQGFEYQAQILKTASLTLSLLSKELNKNEPGQKIVLYQSLIKKDKFEWVLQKGTEVGVIEFVPVLASRVEKLGVGRPDRMQTILREAAEQSGRGRIPALGPVKKFEEVAQAQKGVLNLLLDPAGAVPLARYFPAIPGYGQINILVGPEGGFSTTEIDAAKSGGWEDVNLGPRILRTETAGVLAAGAILIATQA